MCRELTGTAEDRGLGGVLQAHAAQRKAKAIQSHLVSPPCVFKQDCVLFPPVFFHYISVSLLSTAALKLSIFSSQPRSKSWLRNHHREAWS